ncbi:MAG TPA: tRNA (adenosine(37)-N6)-dimethylallyltransferase MiaA [Bryobacteraceae bacterium]|nr:tRNA (adenosine(37)-N6)-dimethylallyltransferase MiaA [Bryobacteraceae bacterium]
MTFEADPIVAIVGPTGSGKSDLALRIAREFSGEVVNCDSLQVYRSFNIGTAKLPPAERQGVPHHLIDVLDPQEVFTAGEYARWARIAIAGIAGRGHLPVVAGGTGFYLRALLEGLFPGPKRNERLRASLARRESRYPGWLHRFLARYDPASAVRIHTSDVQKLIRACEILLIERRPLTELFNQGRDRLEGYRTLKLGIDPPREALYGRINARCERMFGSGLIEEVQGILSAGHPPTSKPFGSVGYKEALALVRGELDLAAAVELAQRSTRRYSKRQQTWFRRDPEIVWLKGFGGDPAVERAALELVHAFLKGVQRIA